ncbi:MAG: hypothetical protein PHS30_06545 [Bacteroidales bacterium]|nr:hypothetical protein [Bacteroidales bacterium]
MKRFLIILVHLILSWSFTGVLGVKQLGDVNENLLSKAMSVLGIINTPASVRHAVQRVQYSKQLTNSYSRQRGLQLDHMPLFK